MLKRGQMSGSDPRVRVAFGIWNALSALVLGVGLFAVVEPRFWVLDLPLGAIAFVDLAAAVALFGRFSWARPALTLAAWLGFGLGLLVISLIALTMSYLRGIHGDPGSAGLAVCALVIALLVPYTVVLPALELLWLNKLRSGSKS